MRVCRDNRRLERSGLPVQFEKIHQILQLAGLIAHRLAGSGGLLNQRGILLRHLVYLQNRLVDLFDARGLLPGSSGHFGNDTADFLDRGYDLFERLARLLDQRAAVGDLGDTVGDQALDFLGSIGAALGQLTHFTGDHRKAPALLAGPCGLNSGVQGQQVRLEGDFVDHPDDVSDLAAALVDRAHGGNRQADHLPALLSLVPGCAGELVGLAGILGALLNRAGQLFHASGGLFQRAGLFFGALR